MTDQPQTPDAGSVSETTDTSELGGMTVEDELTPDPAEREDPSAGSISGDADRLQADDLQADEAHDYTGGGTAVS